ncbi:MAG: GYD domain-containing protein [candidate division NC10 bacterium]|nr:GYD domain-containing protein [candidate division NC10 bacterium]
MPHYIALVSFTDQGIRDVKNSIKRADRVRRLAARHKVKIRDIHWTMGKYDIVVTFDAPSDAALTYYLTATFRPPLPAVGWGEGVLCENNLHGTLTPALSHPGRGSRNECHRICVPQHLARAEGTRLRCRPGH